MVLVGLNINEVNIDLPDKISYIYLTTNYKFYIKISDKVVVQQKCERFIKKFLPDIYKHFKDNIIKDNDKFIDIVKHITLDCSAEKTIKFNKKWNKDYKKMGYKFMTRDAIYKKVCELLNKNI